MKRIQLLTAMLLACGFSYAQSLDKEISSMMGQYALFEVTNAYFTMLETSFPERATRAGLDRANAYLDERTPAAENKRRADVNKTKAMLGKIKKKKLTPTEKTDYEILSRTLALDAFLLSRNRVQTSPLFYLSAHDAVYDVMLKRVNAIRQYGNIEPRAKELPSIYKAGTENLVSSGSRSAALALNKTYAAFTSTEDMQWFLNKNAGEGERADLRSIVDDEKAEIRRFFDKIKTLAREADAGQPKNNAKSEDYFGAILKNRYHFDQTPADLTKTAENALTASKKNLLTMVKAFNLKKEPEPQDFYAIAAGVKDMPSYEKLLITIGEEIKRANKSMRDVLPASEMKVFVNHMPKYPSFLHPDYLFLPPYGVEHNLVGTLFIYTPSDKEKDAIKPINEHIKRYFTMPQIKLLVTENVVPGRQMYYSYSYETKPIRRALSPDTVLDGWTAYSKHLAYETGYIKTKEEVLYLVFDDYARAVKALADLKYNTRALDYDETILFMMSQGINKPDAEIFVRQLAFEPGRFISELKGFEEIKAQRRKYEKVFGTEFNLAGFHNKIFSIGKIPAQYLDAELEAAYKKDNKNVDLRNFTPKINY